MSGAAVLTVLAAVVAVEGGTVRIDRGVIDGLRTGDRGVVYYELTVGEAVRRIDVAEAVVIEAVDHEAVLSAPVPDKVRTGHQVEFRLPTDRLAPAVIVELARARLEEGAFGGTLRDLLERLVPADDDIEEQVIRLLETRRRERRAALPGPSVGGAAGTLPPARVMVPGRAYEIGRHLAETEFYNQQPRFTLHLKPFLIDRRPVTRTELGPLESEPALAQASSHGFATGVTYEEAESFCRSRDGRLPSEFEWEVAVQAADGLELAPIYEWTASWYEAYPGNRFSEPEYGRKYRVVRGDTDPAGVDPRHRRFLAPERADWQVGFRCARDFVE